MRGKRCAIIGHHDFCALLNEELGFCWNPCTSAAIMVGTAKNAVDVLLPDVKLVCADIRCKEDSGRGIPNCVGQRSHRFVITCRMRKHDGPTCENIFNLPARGGCLESGDSGATSGTAHIHVSVTLPIFVCAHQHQPARALFYLLAIMQCHHTMSPPHSTAPLCSCVPSFLLTAPRSGHLYATTNP